MGNRQTIFSSASANDTRRAVEQDLHRATQRLSAMTSADNDAAKESTAIVATARTALQCERRNAAESSRTMLAKFDADGTGKINAGDNVPSKSTHVVPLARRGVPFSAAQRAQQCLSRGKKPLVRDELIAIVLTIQPDFSLSMLQSMRVEDLNKQIRALVVNLSLDKLGLAECEDPN
jgi:hypothetical protein